MHVSDDNLSHTKTSTDRRRIRNFEEEVVKPLQESLPDCAELIRYGTSAGGLPLLMIKAISDPKKPAITMVSGTHGDEPAPISSIVTFVKEDLARCSQNMNFIIYPCINPDGFELNTRENRDGVDLNREFDQNGGPAEVDAFYASLKMWSDCIDVILNLHEDDPGIISDTGPQDIADGLYLYEHRGINSRSGFARELVEAICADYAICSKASLYGDRIVDGVIEYGADSPNHTLSKINLLDNFLIGNRLTARSITVETPTSWSREQRESAHLALIKIAINRVLQHTYPAISLHSSGLPARSPEIFAELRPCVDFY